MEKLIDLSPVPETPKPEVSLSEDVATPMKGESLLNRAFRYHMTLGEESPGIDQLEKDLSSGLESQYQATLQRQEMARRTTAAKELVFDNVQNNPDADPLLVAEMANPGIPPSKDVILEDTWQKKATDALMAADSNSAVVAAMEANPMGVGENLEAFEEINWKRLIRQTWKQRTDQKMKEMGWGPYLGYFGMQLAQVPTWGNIVSNADESEAWYTAGALRDTVAYVNSLPPAEMDAAIREEVERLSAVNPLDAQKFVDAVVSYTATDYDLNILDDLSVIPLGTMAKGVSRAARSVTEANNIAKATVKGQQQVEKSIQKARAVSQAIPPEKVGETPVVDLSKVREEVQKAKTQDQAQKALSSLSPADREVLQNDVLRADWSSIEKLPPYLKEAFKEWQTNFDEVERETMMAPENIGSTLERFKEDYAEEIRLNLDKPANTNATPERAAKLQKDRAALAAANNKLNKLLSNEKALQKEATKLGVSVASRKVSLRGQISRNIENIKKLDAEMGAREQKPQKAPSGRGPTTAKTKQGKLEALLKEAEDTALAGKPMRPGLLDEIEQASVERRRMNRRANLEHIDESTGDKYSIKLVENEAEMPKIKNRTTSAGIWFEEGPKGQHKIYINKPMLYRMWEKKSWTGKDGKLSDGARAFPLDAFKTYDELEEFVIEHEIAHIAEMRARGGKEPATEAARIDMENRVTREAFRRIGRKDLIKRVFPEIFASTENRAASEMSAMSKGVTSTSDFETVMAGTGKPAQAAEMSARRMIVEEFLGEKTPGALKNQFQLLVNRTLSWTNPKVKVNDGDNFHNTAAHDLESLTRRFLQSAIDSARVARVSRLSEEAINEALDKAVLVLQKTYNRLQDRVLDVDGVERVLPGDTPFNTAFVKMNLGDANRSMFNSIEDAEKARQEYGLDPYDASIEESAGKYYLQVYTPVREDNVVDLVTNPINGHNMTSYSFWKRWIGGAKTQHSEFQNMQRSAAIHSEARLGEIIREVYAPFEKLGKRSRKAIDEIMKVNMLTERVPGDPTTRGMYYQSQGELNDGFLKHLGRLPTNDEAQAYFAVVRATDLDYVYRSIGEFKRKAIMGVESIEIPSFRKDSKGNYEPIKTNVEGKIVPGDTVPLDTTDNIGVILIDNQGRSSTVSLKDLRNSPMIQGKNMVTDFTVIRPFKEIDEELVYLSGSEEPIAFVITHKNAVKRSPLRLDKQVNYRQGFHNVYKAPVFLKQARVRNGRYEGDATVMAFQTEAQLKKFGARMEHARKLLKEGKEAELKAYLKDNLPYSYDRFRGLFDNNALDINVPFSFVRHGSNTLESVLADGGKFQDAFPDIDTTVLEKYNLSKGFADPFVAKRDPVLTTIREGTEDKPLLEVADAELLSPMVAQTKAMGDLIKSQLYDDYQLTSAANFVNTFADDIWYAGQKVSKQELQENPIFYLSNGEIRSNNIVRQRQAAALKSSIEGMLKNPSQTALWLDQQKMKLMNTVYEKTGEKYLQYIPDKALPMVSDPVSYMRSVAFHTKLGFFNPVQFFVQGSALTNVIAISPVAGTKAVPAVIAMARLTATRNPKIIESVAEKVASISPGWTKEMFIDSYNAMNRTGFKVIAGGSAWRNDLGDPTLFRGGAGRVFLDKGPMFFNAGESAIRLTSWNTAYLEYIQKFPKKVGKLNEFDLAKIRDRASNLSGNMSRDANSWWQNNAATSMFTQFWSYNVRIAELMMGAKGGGNMLSQGEAIRLMISQAMLWGMPLLGAGAYFLDSGDAQPLANEVNPFAEDFLAYARKNGINMDGTMAEALYTGMVSRIFEAITGEKVDFGSRYGLSAPQVIDTLKRAMRDDATAAESFISVFVTALGPSGSVVNDIFKESSNVARSIYDLVLHEGTHGELLPMDIQNALREVSSINYATRVWMAATQNRIRAQSGSVIAENEDGLMEFVKATLGVENASLTESFNLLDSMNIDAKELEKVKKEARRYLGPYWDALRDNDEEKVRRYGRILQIFLDSTDMTDQEKARFLYPKTEDGLPMDELLFKKAGEKARGQQKQNLKDAYTRMFGN